MPLSSFARPVTINKGRCIRTATRTPPLCYSFPLHGDTPSESVSRRARAGIAVLSELRGGSDGSADLRRLFLGDLPAMRHRAGILGRTRNRIMDPAPVLPASDVPSSALKTPDGKPTLVRGLGLLDSVLLLVSGV